MKMLDTDIIIYMMRKRPEYLIRKFIAEEKKGLCISTVSLAELYEGNEKSDRKENNEKMLSEITRHLRVIASTKERPAYMARYPISYTDPDSQ
ncbi:MAG: type II toxin-antitoxin system VapC family toxin [Oscillospiraceae bacterium]|nr:type II toxin-antitoxin system VapC family toxin [Oscillospiraceae bacterium]